MLVGSPGGARRSRRLQSKLLGHETTAPDIDGSLTDGGDSSNAEEPDSDDSAWEGTPSPSKRQRPSHAQQNSTAKKARQPSRATPVRTTAELPAAVWNLVIQYCRDPRTLALLSQCTTTLRDHVYDLPDHHCLLLDGAERLCYEPIPIRRGLRVCATGACELCGKGKVKGMKSDPYGLFVHTRCLDEQLLNEYYLTEDERARLTAADAPCIIKSGFNPRARGAYREWTARMFWEHQSPLVDDSVTVRGTSGRTLAECAAMGLARKQRQLTTLLAVEDASAKVIEYADARLDSQFRAATARTHKAEDATRRRVLRLDAALVAARLPVTGALMSQFGPAIVKAPRYLGVFLSCRATSPHTLAVGVERVRTMVALEYTLEEKAMFHAVVVVPLDAALQAAGVPKLAALPQMFLATQTIIPATNLENSQKTPALPAAVDGGHGVPLEEVVVTTHPVFHAISPQLVTEFVDLAKRFWARWPLFGQLLRQLGLPLAQELSARAMPHAVDLLMGPSTQPLRLQWIWDEMRHQQTATRRPNAGPVACTGNGARAHSGSQRCVLQMCRDCCPGPAVACTRHSTQGPGAGSETARLITLLSHL